MDRLRLNDGDERDSRPDFQGNYVATVVNVLQAPNAGNIFIINLY